MQAYAMVRAALVVLALAATITTAPAVTPVPSDHDVLRDFILPGLDGIWSVGGTNPQSSTIINNATGNGNVEVTNNGPDQVTVTVKSSGGEVESTTTISSGNSSTIGYGQGDSVSVAVADNKSASGTHTLVD